MPTATEIGPIRYPHRFFRTDQMMTKVLERFLAGLRQRVDTGLHLGAGSSRLEGLINCDLFNPDADMKVDATDLAQFEDASVDLIESHHMIEHLDFVQVDTALKEWSRVLRPGGFLVLTCPDVTGVCLKWLKYSLLYPINPRPDKLDYIIKMMVGSQEHEGMYHKSGYDARRMRRILPDYGFHVDYTFTDYPRRRPTPSLLTIARKA